MSEAKRLHPAAVITNIVVGLKEAVIPIVVTFVLGRNKEEVTNIWDTLIMFLPLIILLFTIISAFLDWFRFTYRLEDDEIRIEHGLFVRKKRYIPCERIQSISSSEGIIQRIFGLVKIAIETAGSSTGEAEASLTAITKDEAERIQLYIKQTKDRAKNSTVSVDENGLVNNENVSEETLAPVKNIVYSMTFKEIIIVALTSGGALGVIGAVIAFLSQFDELISFENIFGELKHIISSGIFIATILAIFVIVVAYIIAVIRTIFKYANFSIGYIDDSIIISQGLLERKQISIPLKRIQAIEVEENFFRRLFGFASVYVVNATESIEKGIGGKITICPLVKKDQIASIINSFLPEYEIDVDLTPVPKRALRRFMLRPILILIVPVALGIYFFNNWGLLLLLLLPLGAYLGYLSYQYAGANIYNKQLTLRSRFITVHTVYMLKNKIQSIEVSKTIFQKRKSLGTVKAKVLSGGARTVDLDDETLNDIFNWFKRSVS